MRDGSHSMKSHKLKCKPSLALWSMVKGKVLLSHVACYITLFRSTTMFYGTNIVSPTEHCYGSELWYGFLWDLPYQILMNDFIFYFLQNV